MAAHSTTDFSVGGEWTRSLNQMTAFLMSRVGGYRRAAQAAVEDPQSMAKRVAGAISLVAAGLWCARKYFEDENTQALYDELPSYEKNQYWHVRNPLSESGWLRFSKPFELGLLFGTSIEMALDYAYKKDPELVMDRLEEGFNLRQKP